MLIFLSTVLTCGCLPQTTTLPVTKRRIAERGLYFPFDTSQNTWQTPEKRKT